MSTEFSLHITRTAAAALVQIIANNNISEPVLTLVKLRQGDGLEAPWNVGIYEKGSLLPNTAITTIENLEFYFDPSVHEEIVGCTLDVIDGHFRILA